MPDKLEHEISYKAAGVDIAQTDEIKRGMSEQLRTEDTRVLNRLGAFASLYDLQFDEIKHPVLVLKVEEPGSKQKLAFEYGYIESLCHDMINHLVNDIIVMGARPMAVLDVIVSGQSDDQVIHSLVKGMSDACKDNNCSLVGGETSIQPGIIKDGTSVLTSSVAGIVDKENIIDGSHIKEGDVVIALASNGIHTNGYSLVRYLMEKKPDILKQKIDDHTFIESIMAPHTSYCRGVQEALEVGGISGMAHITGGGIEGNLSRVIPDGLSAKIDLSRIKTLPLFKLLKQWGNIDDPEMLRTFNCGVGMVIVCAKNKQSEIEKAIKKYSQCYAIGDIKKSETSKIAFCNQLIWGD
ncbi:phosphoribosylformylglycinamidine cyclo-ligase [Sporolactobacillus pectinivorans]|uniref:phosphoribosylformylglycinamidine cyclo-ligase n=1 Tax=Sporolactobacillus pectinivorans TaxID=1591408 RepID=UPI001EFCB003|nr:phosphoribosylformylglycinamidine cyclo-ligase [Sporolactobacillus pectinivorans]